MAALNGNVNPNYMKRVKKTRVFKYNRYWKLTYQCRKSDCTSIVSKTFIKKQEQ